MTTHSYLQWYFRKLRTPVHFDSSKTCLLMIMSVCLVLPCPATRANGPQRVGDDLPLGSVTVDDDFWTPMMEVWQRTTIRDCFAKFENDGAFRNFERIRDGRAESHESAPWFDGLVYEMIAASSDFLARHPDPQLQHQLDEYAKLIAAAAERDPDGYINTYTQLEDPTKRWGRNGGNLRYQHDVYNIGCLVEAAVHHYQATGDTRLLKTATTLVGHMAEEFGFPPRLNVIPGHALPEVTLVSLYQLLRDDPALAQEVCGEVEVESILRLAEFFVQARGHYEGRTSLEAYAQDARPVAELQTMEGHAVRATLLCAGMAALAQERPDGVYRECTQRLWQNMTTRRMYITGAVGAIAHDERFGDDYELPNDGYMEICGSVAAGMFHHNMGVLTGDGKYYDELERVLYNGILAGVSQSGDQYLYTNPLTASAQQRRWQWHGCPCCPPMFLKMMGALPGYIYSTRDDGVAVNLFIGSHASLPIGDQQVTIHQSTDYPWNGSIHLKLQLDSPSEFTVRVRLPQWCDAPRLRVNGKPVDSPRVEQGYAVLTRQWSTGDAIQLELPLVPQLVHDNPLVTTNQGYVAIERGPLVYCLENCDNQNLLSHLYFDQDTTLRVESRDDLLGGIDAIRCTANVRGVPAEASESDSAEADHTIEALAIPFYAHSNRQPTARRVWLPEQRQLAEAQKPATIASQAEWTASHCWSGDTTAALNDQLDVAASDDQTTPRFSWWNHRGTTEWVQADLADSTEVSEVQVYWWDDRRLGAHCRTPLRWRVLTLQEGEWKPIAEQTAGATAMDRFCSITFPRQSLSTLRIEVELQPEWSAGILEVQIK
ncbi:glycoside hydrolase family 127 protein [Aeoliella mucimassa]|uniref:Non-reducing end beta-L-arabinofuranosidase n=1 Tax=Aeoliella mucimassa TaxID=2527972 RepID=A0A518AN94_9BACT|nr:beta-L-arabinofuranosidase domain-containing protein [Aeoliella mucimassa]QDU56205.1 Non-reducing end beta-L-arabinofuranosidase [Aeoliella mucimassa]